MKKLTPLLSDSIRECLKTIFESHGSKIANDLLTADKYINVYNKLIDTWGLSEDDRKELCQILGDKVNQLITDEVRALSIRRDVFEVSFIPKGKDLIYTESGNWSRENRQTGKPGRIIKKVLMYDYKERDIEIFSNQFKAELMNAGDFRIVSGEDICHWYNQNNYYKLSGTLGNSCMKYCECENYFQVYEDHAEMLILVKNGLLLGRAIVWRLDNKTYMDRVYVCMDYLEEQFIQYAMQNKWYIRKTQSLLSSGNNQEWLDPESNYRDVIVPCLTIKLRYNYNKFPYMDSFRYLDPDNCIISTIANFGRVCLDSTDGYWEDDTLTAECECCGCTETYCDGDQHPYNWSEYSEEYLCDNCSTYNYYLETYIRRDIPTVTVSFLDRTYQIPTEFVNSQLVTTDNFTTFYSEDYFIEINGNYYSFDMVEWNEKDNEYKLKDE